ncbi:glycoside hydrolase family 43 protein [Marmoricola sp. RAF53]|uniref:glycoside hydrolase family 43 protein n=1 Tax=Marmoricola sp. RAF53 TaxID=3233059 RepID=UPI003F98BC64
MLLAARRPFLLLLTAVLVASVLSAAGPAEARGSADKYRPGRVYRGDFPDPQVLRVGHQYFAYATSTGRRNLPVLRSRDARIWRARGAGPRNPSGDALVRVARWARGVKGRHGRVRGTVWAPTVTRLGQRRYVLAYATRVARPHARRGRMCVSVATGRTPVGPFVDRSRRPLVCPRAGAIDPQVYLAPHGRPWLLWKVDSRPSRLLTRPMAYRATRFMRGTHALTLARVKQRWEGRTIENPGMIRYRGRYYLFYSGNRYASSRYAIGYLICRSVRGGCHRPRKRPLIASHGRIAGPGGAAPFVDTAGRLRLAYHAWRRGKVGYTEGRVCTRRPAACGQRRLYVATVRPGRHGVLRVVARH